MTVPSSLVAVAMGDFNRYVRTFCSAGLAATEVAPGILQIVRDPSYLSLLLSVGLHGDETAPIELVTQLIDTLATQPEQLAINLMIVVGNPAAIAQGRRFVEVDLNRLFSHDQGDLKTKVESVRAHQIMQASRDFFEAAHGARWHLDLHAAIRPSLYPTFALVPDAIMLPQKQALVSLLGHAGVGAVIVNRSAASTFSAFTAAQLDAASATVELGQIGALGRNNMTNFADAATTLATLLREARVAGTPRRMPVIFALAKEIIKISDAFVLHIDPAMANFTPLAPDSIIATDGAVIHRVGPCEERMVFPNPSVRIGQRAGLMVVPGAIG